MTSPKIWGPAFWTMLRSIAADYPLNPTKEDNEHIKVFFTVLQYLLPCEICKYTYGQHLKKHPIEPVLGSREKLKDWVERVYLETKKVISDNRVKVMTTNDEDDQLVVVKNAIMATQSTPKVHEQITIPSIPVGFFNNIEIGKSFSAQPPFEDKFNLKKNIVTPTTSKNLVSTFAFSLPAQPNPTIKPSQAIQNQFAVKQYQPIQTQFITTQPIHQFTKSPTQIANPIPNIQIVGNQFGSKNLDLSLINKFQQSITYKPTQIQTQFKTTVPTIQNPIINNVSIKHKSKPNNVENPKPRYTPPINYKINPKNITTTTTLTLTRRCKKCES